MSYTTRIAWEALRSVNSTGFSGTYVAVGGPLLFPSYKCKLVNNSSSLVTVSIDGKTDIDVAPANSYWLYDEAAFGIPSIQFLSQGTQFYVKGAAGTGLVYLVSQYLIQP